MLCSLPELYPKVSYRAASEHNARWESTQDILLLMS